MDVLCKWVLDIVRDSDNIHFIIMDIVIAYKGRIELLLITKEKYILFTKHVDSIINKNDQKKTCIKL